MKIKKALAVLLAVVMLVLPLAVTSFAADGIVYDPIKTTYYDTDRFNPQGLVISVDGREITYSPADTKFRFDPALDELLYVSINELGDVVPIPVDVYYNNAYIGSVKVVVNHKLGELTPVNNGHGHFCLGCGKLFNFDKHTVDNWVPNDDGGFFIEQTQTGKCTVCNAEVTESIPDSEKFNSIFDFNSMTDLEIQIVGYMQNILVTLIQMLTSIS